MATVYAWQCRGLQWQSNPSGCSPAMPASLLLALVPTPNARRRRRPASSSARRECRQSSRVPPITTRGAETKESRASCLPALNRLAPWAKRMSDSLVRRTRHALLSYAARPPADAPHAHRTHTAAALTVVPALAPGDRVLVTPPTSASCRECLAKGWSRRARSWPGPSRNQL